MKKINTIAVILFTLLSCSKSELHSGAGLSGVYFEKSPHSGRSQLTFLSGNIVIRSEAGSEIEDSYKYRVMGNKIIFIPTWNETLSTEFQFEKINKYKFQIENIFPQIPENPPTYMTFEKR